MKGIQGFDPSVPSRRWGLFLLLLVVNSLLSYGSFGLQAKLWLGLFGLALPLGWAVLTLQVSPRRAGTRDRSEWIPPGPFPFLALGSIGAFVFIYQTLLSPLWPLPDEGYYGSLALDLSQGNFFDLFKEGTPLPSVPILCMALYFHLVGPSLLSMKVLPALLSLASGCATYWAARRIFPRGFSFAASTLVLLGFWNLYSGSFFVWYPFQLLWQVLCLGTLVVFLKAEGPRERKRTATWLGLCSGAGVFIYLASSWVLFLVALGLWGNWRRIWEREKPLVLHFIVPFLAAAGFFGACSELGMSAGYIGGLWKFRPGMDLSGTVVSALNYVSGIFWGGDFHNSYGPVLGGMLNPLATTLFFMGFLGSLRRRDDPFSRWLLWALALAPLPGILSGGEEVFRTFQVFPLLVLTACLGFGVLLQGMARRTVWALTGGILVLSSGLDIFHLTRMHPGRLAPVTGAPLAYRILLERSKVLGPGSLFFDAKVHEGDPSLGLLTFPFDPLRNRDLASEEPRWMAVIENVNYSPFLKARFKGVEVHSLHPSGPDGSPGRKRVLFIIPLGKDDRKVLARWREADRKFGKVVLRTYGPWREKGPGLLERIEALHDGLERDPFLESLYWTMVFQAHNWEVSFGDGDKPRHFWAVLGAVENILKSGYPAAHVLNEWGELLRIKGDLVGARKAFERALACEVNETDAARNLEALGRAGRSSAP